MKLFDRLHGHISIHKTDGDDNGEEEQQPLQSPPETPGPEAGDYKHPGIDIPGETESPDSSQL